MIDFSKFSFPRNKASLFSTPIYYEHNHVGYYFDNVDSSEFQGSQVYFFRLNNQADNDRMLQALRKEFNISPKRYNIYIPVEDFLSRLASNQLGYLLLHQDNLLRSAVAIHVGRSPTTGDNSNVRLQ